MPVDTSMYLQNPLRTVADYEGQLINQRLNQQAIQQNALKMDEYGRTVNDQQRVRALLSGTNTPEEAVTLLRRNGYYDHAAAIEKEITARDKTRTDTKKVGAEVTASHVKLMKDMAGVIAASPTPQTWTGVLNDWEGRTGLPAGTVRTAFEQAGNDPEQIKRIAFSIATEADKLLPKTGFQDTGGAVQATAIDPITGAPTVTGTMPKTQSPDNAASTAVQMRGQNMTDARERDRIKLAQDALVMDTGGPTQAALVKKFGKAEPGRRWKEDGSQEPIPGGSADSKAQMKAAGEGTVSNVVAELRDTFDQLDAGGGITNPDKGTLGNLGAGVSSSAVGQAAGRMLGTQNQSLRNKVSQARPLLLSAIMRATGMSAKQMDSNAELKLWLSTATDPTLDVKANRAALDRIEQMFGGGGATTAAPSDPFSAADAILNRKK